MNKEEILRKLANKEITPAKAKDLYHHPESVNNPMAIAVTGIALRFPGAENVDMYWHNLLNGVSSIIEVPMHRWHKNVFYSGDAFSSNKTDIKWGGFLDGIENFDADFFHIPAYDACFIDPQQRIFLEECYRALEVSGYTQSMLNGLNCGVYAGINEGDYADIVKTNQLDKVASCSLGVPANFTAARIAYFLNLTGPAITLDTACSSSLVAIHLACQGIVNHDCDVALAGGVFTMNTPDTFVKVAKLGILSKQGQCRPFDVHADGTVISEGVGVLVLKPLKQALADHNYIYGLIQASAINQDGRTNGIASPSGAAQVELIRRLYQRYAIDYSSIGYIETHGTGTQLGDAIEFNALAECFRNKVIPLKRCAVGAVKANIGHTSAAAGVAGVIKALLAIDNKQLPPQIHFQQLNAKVSCKGTPFFINTQGEHWQTADSEIKMAAVSSFGMAGTNAHIIIQEAPELSTSLKRVNLANHIFTFSAKNGFSLKQKINDLYQWLVNHSDCYLSDIAYTLNACRTHFNERVGIVADSSENLRIVLKNILTDEYPTIKNTYCCTKQQLSSFASHAVDANKIFAIIETDNSADTTYAQLCLLAQLYVAGEDINWSKLYSGDKHWILPMPAYPFFRKRYWVSDIIQHDKTEKDVEKIFEAFLGREGSMLDKNASFEALGVDSILLFQIINHIKIQLSVEVNLNDLINIQSIAQLISYIKQQGDQTIVNQTSDISTHSIQQNNSSQRKLIDDISVNNNNFFELLTLADGGQIEISIAGNGPPLLFLPPVDCLSTAWFAQIDYFAKKYQVITVHYPGYGNSAFQLKQASIFNIAATIKQVLEQLNIKDELTLIGWSLGGLVAQTFAVHYPALLKKLCLVNTTARLEVDSSTENIEKLIDILKHDLAKVSDKWKNTSLEMNLIDFIKATKSNLVFMHYAREILAFDSRDALPKINIPTLIISGENDALTPAIYSEFLHSHIKYSQYLLHPEAGHYIPLAEPEFFNEHLERFLND